MGCSMPGLILCKAINTSDSVDYDGQKSGIPLGWMPLARGISQSYRPGIGKGSGLLRFSWKGLFLSPLMIVSTPHSPLAVDETVVTCRVDPSKAAQNMAAVSPRVRAERQRLIS